MKRQLGMGMLLALLILLLVACRGSGDRTTMPSGMQDVQINETEFKIVSSVTSFSPGVSYHFAVTNHGKTLHEFMIMPKPHGNVKMGMESMDKMALASIESIKPGETKTLNYTFSSSLAGSHL